MTSLIFGNWHGVHSSEHTNCHHQITHGKLNLNIVFLPPYECLVRNYKRRDVTAIRKALDAVDWDFIYLNKTVHDQALSFDQVLMNIFTDDDLYNRYNYFGDQDPPWMNDRIKLKNSFKHIVRTAKLHKIIKNFNLQ